jgi:hypothetical protein
MTKRYYPAAIPGTSGADHLVYEVEEQLPAAGYSSRAAAARGWTAACRRANAVRRRQGYAAVSRPSCRVEAR